MLPFPVHEIRKVTWPTSNNLPEGEMRGGTGQCWAPRVHPLNRGIVTCIFLWLHIIVDRIFASFISVDKNEFYLVLLILNAH